MKRRKAAAIAIAAFGTPALLGNSIAQADTPAADWGVNSDGWHVHIVNKSSTPLSTFVTGLWSNVDSRTGNLDVGHEAHVHGIKSKLTEGPADIDFEYRQSRGMFVPGIAVQVQGVRTFGDTPDATCLVTFSPNLGCSVQSVSRNQPIEVVIFNTHP